MNIPAKLETAANAATVLAALLLSFLLVKIYLRPERAAPGVAARPPIAVGAKLNTTLPGVDWGKNGRTLVLAISTQCHFCPESAPFFRTVVAKARKGIKIVAVLPQPVDAARNYLNGEGVHVDQIEQADLNRIGVRGTPTTLLVNSSGTVTNMWVGRLEPTEQGQALHVLESGNSGIPVPARPLSRAATPRKIPA
jgi:hypothetical protein